MRSIIFRISKKIRAVGWQKDLSESRTLLPQNFGVAILNNMSEFPDEKIISTEGLNYQMRIENNQSPDKPIVVISGLTRYTYQPANYRIKITKDQINLAIDPYMIAILIPEQPFSRRSHFQIQPANLRTFSRKAVWVSLPLPGASKRTAAPPKIPPKIAPSKKLPAFLIFNLLIIL